MKLARGWEQVEEFRHLKEAIEAEEAVEAEACELGIVPDWAWWQAETWAVEEKILRAEIRSLVRHWSVRMPAAGVADRCV